ncbi:MAG TPA: ABC transporter permease [Candidatus Onthousia excrementipullorum]|uniref:ABC transporter permease n=1 Tax=Candidatus Onthousia excrementipullorum TaxID=2840884 RepID=A0A9D1J2U2_9FIRM|nr:ABC transporter permease [Candidatus Onthousia excrementipullorum]
MSNLGNILKKELREMFRDKKSLAMMLIIPILIPALVIGMSALFESEVNKPITDYNKIGFNYELGDMEKDIAENLDIEVISGTTEELENKYSDGSIDLYITKDGSTYTINGEDNETSTYATSLMDTYFATYKEALQTNYLASNNINPTDVTNIITVNKEITETENFYGNYIVNYGFLFIIMAITISATYPATDTTAGEKERGTLETLLTFPIKSKDIIVGKFLSVSLSSIITGVISLILMLVSLAYANSSFEIYKDTNLMLSPSSLIFAIVVIIAYSLLISGLCIAIASKSKTFKEAQSALTPLTFISFFPGMIAFMAGISSSPILSLVPFLNFTLLFQDIVVGNINIVNILLMSLSTVVIIALVLVVIIKQYKSEKVLF